MENKLTWADMQRLWWTLVGTGIMCAGACALNHVVESDIDSKMKRTRHRPIPSGQVSKLHASLFGVSLCIVASVVLLGVSMVMMIGGVVTAGLYLFVYTPLKQVTAWNTLIGGIPGALPAMGGYLSVSGQLNWVAIAVFLLIYSWQQPHFHAIALVTKTDYKAGGLKMLTVLDPTGKTVFFHAMCFTVLMVVASLSLVFTDILGQLYFIGSLLLGIWFTIRVLRTKWNESNSRARQLIKDSVIYIQLLLVLMLMDSVLYFL